MKAMKVHVRYFASLREALGAQQAIEMPADSTLGALRDALAASSALHGELLAFFPPVTGG